MSEAEQAETGPLTAFEAPPVESPRAPLQPVRATLVSDGVLLLTSGHAALEAMIAAGWSKVLIEVEVGDDR